MSLLKSFSFNCHDIKLINGDTFGYINGSGLTLWNVATNEKDFLPSNRYGFSKFTANHKYNIFACAEYGLDPQINVYSYPDKEIIYTFESISSQMYSHFVDPGQLDVIDLFISRNGKRLLAVFGCPKYEIKVWDLESGEDLKVKSYKIDPKEYIKVLFNPFDHNSFIILNKNSLSYCEVKPAWNVQGVEGEVPEKIHQLEVKTFKKPKGHMPNEYIDAIWDQHKRLFVTDTMCNLHVYNVDKVHDNYHAHEQETVGLDMSRQKYYYYRKEDARAAKDKEDDNGPSLKHYAIPLDYLCCAMVLTQKHLIIAKDNNFIEWYSLQTEDPEGRIEVEKDYQFEKSANKIISLTYNQQLEKLYIATDGGEFFMFPIKAETNIEEDDEHEEKEDKEEAQPELEDDKLITAEVEEVGTSHSKGVTFLKEIPKTSYLISAGLDGKVLVWNGFEGKIIGQYISESDITCGDISPDGKILVLGTTQSCIKVFDITERLAPRLLQIRRIFKKDKEITQVAFSPDGSLIAVTGHSKRLFFLHGQTAQRWKVFGKVKLQMEICSFQWCDKKMPNNRPGILAISNQGLLFAVSAPIVDVEKQNVDFDTDACPIYIRRTDFLLNKIAVIESTGEVLVTGKDRMLKKYRFPDENILRTDPKSKPPSNPLEELPGHDLPVTVVAHSSNGKFIAMGSQDGTITFRDTAHLAEAKSFKAHNYKEGGVTSLCISQHGDFIYSGGNDGSIQLWAIHDQDPPEIVNQETVEDEALQSIPEEEDQFDDDIKHYVAVIQDEEYEAQSNQREEIRKDLVQTLSDIKSKLQELLMQNDYADDLEKLERDDFVIDLEGRDKILREGEEKRQQMKAEAQRENYKNEILYQKIKENTYDKMEVHLKGLVGLQSNTIVYNFQIRKRTEAEKRKLKLALDMRKMEMRERAAREERKQKEVLQVETICAKPDAYIVNGLPGYKPLVLVDYEAKEDIPEPKREIEEGDKRVNRHADERRNRMAAARSINRRQVQPQKKVVTEEEEKKEEEKKNEQEDKEKKEKEENPEWDFIYGAFDLFTPNRKRTQIQILKNIIFRIKEKFNKEFEALVAARHQQVETINEKNNRIKEILETLQQEVILFKPRVNIFEKPERVLTVEPQEIGFERYLTKEEREKLEEERRKEEERLRLLRADDAGVRAINQMMGGTLEEKKETPLNETLVREEWMNKPLDDMTEEERMKLREFEAKEQKLKEEKEKIKKNLELELKKLRNDIQEICTKFDERLFILFRRRLEYEYRIYEQEMFIIRLTLSILMEEENKAKTFNFERILKELYHKNEVLEAQKAVLEELKRSIEHQRDQIEAEYKEVLLDKRGFPKNVVLIYTDIFENQKKDDKKAKDQEEWLKDPSFNDLLIKLDPFYELDKIDAKKMYDEQFRNYMDEINRRIENYRSQQDISEADKERFIAAFERKFQLRKQLDLAEKQKQDIEYYNKIIKDQQEEVKAEIRKKFLKTIKLRERLEKSVSNIELQIRFNQGQVEINQDEPIPRLADAILIKRSLIEAKNKEIKEKGHEKIEQMKANTNTKFEVEDLKHQTLIYEWKIRDIVAKTNEVKRLKVKKEWQVALTKKDQGVNQAELTKLAKQSQLLKEATEKRINIYKKKEEKIKREIEYLLKENQQLTTQGHALGMTVKQRTDIAKMMDEKNEMKLAGDEGVSKLKKSSQTIKIDPESDRKFKEISQNKRLFELAKRQTEEIELLREELNRLKAKTFANFTNQVHKF